VSATYRPVRPALLLTAVLAVTLPGLLTGCSGSAGPVTAGPAPESASSVAASPGGTPAAKRASSPLATRLLTQAAQAAVVISYQGEEIVSHWDRDGESVLMSDIWHVSGGQTVTQTVASGPAASGQPYTSSDTDGQRPEGVLGVTTQLVQLLEAHYIVAYARAGSADNRSAQVVEAWRNDGSLAARFWLDEATKLPLEREVFDSAAHVISEDVFVDVRFPGPAAVSAPAGGPADPPGPWTTPLTSRQLLALRARGWLVPASLPVGLSLFTGAQTQTSTGTVLDLGYSDGLSVVSVFEQRGNLAASLAGWQKVTLAGHVVYAADPDQASLTWSSRGMVYTVLADAPAQTVDSVVGALPHDAPPGFWKRMSHGVARLASWANPFG
jgi:sigma-E factor negative regulatory protein RseB